MASEIDLISRLRYNANEYICTTHNTTNNAHFFHSETINHFQLIKLLEEMTEEIASLKNQLRNVTPYDSSN